MAVPHAKSALERGGPARGVAKCSDLAAAHCEWEEQRARRSGSESGGVVIDPHDGSARSSNDSIEWRRPLRGMLLRPMPLSHALVTAAGATPRRWMLFLHGILGSGANWRSFARALVAARPEWGAVLVDLRLHGESLEGFDPPHTVDAAAADVHALFDLVPGPVRGVLAHSFGGKVALALDARVSGDLDHVFIVDATPSARPDARGSESTKHIVELLTTLPPEFPDRDSFIRFVEERGVSRPTAMWLAMNVRPVPNTTRYVFRIDVPAIRGMLEDYFARDLWPVVEQPPGVVETHLVVGARSSVVPEEDRARARRCPRMTVDVIEGAGHWVHADAPDALREIVLTHLGE